MDEIRKLVKEAVEKFGEIDDQVQWLEVEARKLSGYKGFLAGLAHTAFKALVYQRRHTVTAQTKSHSTKRKVNPHDPAVDRVHLRAFAPNFFINGQSLDTIKGRELLPLAEIERAIGQGHVINAAFLERLHPLVAAEKEVGKALPDKRIKAIHQAIVDEQDDEQDEGLAMAGN